MRETPRRGAPAPASCYSHSNLICPVGFNDFCFRSVEGGGETYEVFFACSNDLVMIFAYYYGRGTSGGRSISVGLPPDAEISCD